MNEERKHALLSASTAHRWLTCTPSARLEAEEDVQECSVYAEEGTYAHELSELMLQRRFEFITEDEYKDKLLELTVSELGKKYHNMELVRFCEEHVEFVVSLVPENETFNIYFELRLNFSNFVPQGFGTADICIVTENCVHIIDLKFGRGVPISAIENPQLRLYGLGGLNLFPQSSIVKMTINQPRLDSNDTEILTREELLKWGREEVIPKADLAIKGEGLLKSSETACRFCKLKGKCKVRAETQMELARQEFAMEQIRPELLSPEYISEILEIAPLFIDWFKDVQSHALGQLMSGVKIPNYKLVEGRSVRQITDDEAVRQIFLDIGFEEKDIMERPKLKGITKLESLIGKKLFAEVCKEYLIKPQGRLTMALESDKRPAVNSAQFDFNILYESEEE